MGNKSEETFKSFVQSLKFAEVVWHCGAIVIQSVYHIIETSKLKSWGRSTKVPGLVYFHICAIALHRRFKINVGKYVLLECQDWPVEAPGLNTQCLLASKQTRKGSSALLCHSEAIGSVLHRNSISSTCSEFFKWTQFRRVLSLFDSYSRGLQHKPNIHPSDISLLWFPFIFRRFSSPLKCGTASQKLCIVLSSNCFQHVLTQKYS